MISEEVRRAIPRGSRLGQQRVVVEWTRYEAERMAEWLLTLRALERRARRCATRALAANR